MIVRSLISTPFRVLMLFGLLAVVGLKVFAGGLSTTEYHPRADETAARAVLEENGFTGDRSSGQALFVPEVRPGVAVGMETRLSHTTVADDGATTVYAAVGVRASEGAEGGRSPLNISLVIDRSGSMAGQKLEQAKAAARELVDTLGPSDRLSLVAYGSEVEVLTEPVSVTESNRAKLFNAIHGLYSRGGTFLSGGYEVGLDMALSQMEEDTINRVILLSDLQATEGLVEAGELSRVVSAGLERGVSLTTMGVGLDYDEDLMSAIGRAGAGNYYFIADSDDTSEILADELAGLKSATARETRLSFLLPHGVELVDVHGFDYIHRGELATVELDAFFAGQQKDFLVELRVEGEAPGSMKLLDAELEYVDVATEQPVRQTASVSTTVSRGAAEVDSRILSRVQQVRTAHAFSRAMQLYDKGFRHEAADMLDAQREKNDDFLDQYNLSSNSFDRVGEELARLADQLRRTKRYSTSGSYLSKSTKYRSYEIVESSVKF